MNRRAMVFMGLGFELLGVILGAIFLGGKLDEHFKTQGMITAGMILLFMAGWIYHLIVLLQKINNDQR